MTKLTLKQQKFVEEALKTLNPTEAVRRVYNLGSRGGSRDKKRLEQTARSIACQNLTKINIRQTFRELLNKIDDEALLNRLNEIALGSDKRAALEGIKEIFRLKDRYPKQKLAIDIFEEELKKIKD